MTKSKEGFTFSNGIIKNTYFSKRYDWLNTIDVGTYEGNLKNGLLTGKCKIIIDSLYHLFLCSKFKIWGSWNRSYTKKPYTPEDKYVVIGEFENGVIKGAVEIKWSNITLFNGYYIDGNIIKGKAYDYTGKLFFDGEWESTNRYSLKEGKFYKGENVYSGQFTRTEDAYGETVFVDKQNNRKLNLERDKFI